MLSLFLGFLLIACTSIENTTDTSQITINSPPTIDTIVMYIEAITYDDYQQRDCQDNNYGRLEWNYTEIWMFGIEDPDGLDDIKPITLSKVYEAWPTQNISASFQYNTQYWIFERNDLLFTDYGQYQPVICIEDYSNNFNCYSPKDTHSIFEYLIECIPFDQSK